MYIIENRKWKIIPPLFWKYFFHSRRYVLGYPIKDQVWIFVWCRPERSDIPNSVNFEIFQKFQWIFWHCLKKLNPLKFLISLKFTELGVKFPKYKYFFHGFFWPNSVNFWKFFKNFNGFNLFKHLRRKNIWHDKFKKYLFWGMYM